MSASQERQPTLDSVAPRLLVGDMERAMAFYGQLGFATTYHDEGFAIVERDRITLHFNVSEKEGCRCVILASPISRRYISTICQLALFNLLLLSRRHLGERKNFGFAIPFAIS